MIYVDMIMLSHILICIYVLIIHTIKEIYKIIMSHVLTIAANSNDIRVHSGYDVTHPNLHLLIIHIIMMS